MPVKGQFVTNVVSGESGLVRGIWLNQWTNQWIINVRVNGLAASWNVAEIEVL